jgi:hypothetical protein
MAQQPDKQTPYDQFNIEIPRRFPKEGVSAAFRVAGVLVPLVDETRVREQFERAFRDHFIAELIRIVGALEDQRAVADWHLHAGACFADRDELNRNQL